MFTTIMDYIVEESDSEIEFSLIGSIDTGNFLDFEKKFEKDLRKSDEKETVVLSFDQSDDIHDVGIGYFLSVMRRLRSKDKGVKVHGLSTMMKRRFGLSS